MTEGTKSYLIGCHQFLLHPLCVFLAWRLEYKTWPKLWHITCIILHDIGICGRNYLSDDRAKIGHWMLGADIAYKLLGQEGFFLTAGHAKEESGFDESLLARADKRSWLVAPMPWLWWNYWVEGWKIKPGEWKKMVVENLRQKNPIGNHQLYLKHKEIVE